MKKINSQDLVTVIVVNYNNAKYISRCIKSIEAQSYKKTEIIFVDDQSKDNSIEVAKKFKKLKIFKTSKRTNFGSFNQINAYYTGFLKSKGKTIFFLDSDDFYKKNKIKIINHYIKKKNLSLIMDKPYIYFSKSKFYKMKISNRSKWLIPWPKFPCQSCIAIRRVYLNKIFSQIKIKKFPNIWFDFRLVMQTLIDFNKIYISDEYLTVYQQSSSSISSGFKKYSKKWWLRRKEAHLYIKYLFKKNKKKSTSSIDEYITKLVNLFI